MTHLNYFYILNSHYLVCINYSLFGSVKQCIHYHIASCLMSGTVWYSIDQVGG